MSEPNELAKRSPQNLRVPQPGDAEYWPPAWTSPYGNILPGRDPFVNEIGRIERKSSSRWRTLAIVLVAVLGVFSCGLFFVLMPNEAASNRPAGERAFDSFLKAAAARNVDQAHTYLDPAFTGSYLTKDLLRTSFIEPAAPTLAGYTSLQTLNTAYNDDGGSNLYLSGQLNYQDGRKSTFEVRLIKSGGNWYISNFRIDRP
jgi:hypothetical protein